MVSEESPDEMGVICLMAIGDIYMLRDRQRAAYGTEIENVYFYIGTGDGLAQELGEAFADDMLPLIADLQPVDYTHYAVEVLSLFDPSDFASLAVDVEGTVLTETSAPYTAVNFTLRLPTRAIRPGSKRIGPVPENASQNGVIVDAGYISAMEALRFQMGEVISDPVTPTATYTPVVVKRIKYTEDDKVKYRLPVNFGEAEYAFVSAVTTTTLTSHQVSRERVN